MKINIQLTTDNAAFEESPGSETARILRNLADRLDETGTRLGHEIALMDINGNRVGEYQVS